MKGDQRRARAYMDRLSAPVGKKGNIVLSSIYVIILLFVLFLVGTMLAKTQGSIRDTLTVGTSEYNVANKSLVGMATALGDNASSIYLVAVVVLIIGLIMGVVVMIGKFRG